MMDGVEILSQSVCTELNPIAVFVCLLVCMLVGWVIDEINDLTEGILGIIAGAVLGLFAYVIIFHCIFPVKYISYKVTISEDVSITEFYERYEIIDVDGAIYTIRNKKVNDT